MAKCSNCGGSGKTGFIFKRVCLWCGGSGDKPDLNPTPGAREHVATKKEKAGKS